MRSLAILLLAGTLLLGPAVAEPQSPLPSGPGLEPLPGLPLEPASDDAGAGAKPARPLTISMKVTNDIQNRRPVTQYSVSDPTVSCTGYTYLAGPGPANILNAYGLWPAGEWALDVDCWLLGDKVLEKTTIEGRYPNYQIVEWHRYYDSVCKDPAVTAKSPDLFSSLSITSACEDGPAASCSTSPVPLDSPSEDTVNLARACAHQDLGKNVASDQRWSCRLLFSQVISAEATCTTHYGTQKAGLQRCAPGGCRDLSMPTLDIMHG